MNFEEYLEHSLDTVASSRVKDAMQYSLMAPGKRLRPKLVILTAEGYGVDPQEAYPAAAALEMIHTYSLIHDDLPAMDDDDLRRGRKTCHVEFDEATAILAGDGLLTEAFSHLAKSSASDSIKAQCMKILSFNAGADGMVLGQILDLMNENNESCTYETLEQIHVNKTGRLFSAAFQLGAASAGRFDELDRLNEIGLLLGLAFQIQDDLLDVTSTSEMMGKTIGKDAESHKSTTCSILGMEKSHLLLEETYKKMLEKLGECSFDTAKILDLLMSMKNRNR